MSVLLPKNINEFLATTSNKRVKHSCYEYCVPYFLIESGISRNDSVIAISVTALVLLS